MNEFYMVLTNTGLAKLTSAQITNGTVNLTHLAVGDGNGAYYTPSQTATGLKREVWRGPVASVEADVTNPNWLNIEGTIPATAGGFTIRELGIFDGDGDLFALGKVPETYKPVLAQGSTKDLYLKAILEVANTSNVTMVVDPNVIVASRKYVDDKYQIFVTNLTTINQRVTDLKEEVTTHLADYVEIDGSKIATDANKIGIIGKVVRQRTGANTLNTPYKEGLTGGATAGFVESCYTNAQNAVQVYQMTGSASLSSVINYSFRRSMVEGMWTEWRRSADLSDFELNKFLILGIGIAIPSGADLNEYKTAGIFNTASAVVSASLLNAPANIGGGSGARLTVKYGANTSSCIQRLEYLVGNASGNNSRRVFYRAFNGDWSPWTLELHTQYGAGSPEGVVTAPIGSLYINLSGGATTTLYIKTSGTGNTGWTAK